MITCNKSEIIEHLERGIQTEQNFSFNLAIKWAKSSVNLLKAELPHETEAIEEIRRVFHLKKWHGAEYGCKVVNKVYENAIKELKICKPS